MQLKPQDVVVLLKLVVLDKAWNYRSLAQELFMSTGEVHNALDRAARAKLFDTAEKRPRLQALDEFLVHGLKYAFPAERGSLIKGMPTGYAAPPLNRASSTSDSEHPAVWPDPDGSTRGYKLEPLYASVPKAAKTDRSLYELLALVDAIRDGRARERAGAIELLHRRLKLTTTKP
jgi:hypothetical protein